MIIQLFKQLILLLVIGTLFSQCAASKKVKMEDSPYPMMIGSFDSEAQSIQDSAFYNISLHMYPIWKKDKIQWLYVEQALASRQEAPYRQRIYKLEKMSNGTFKSSVYKMKDEKSFIGKWKTPKHFDKFDQSILEEREGCAVYLAPKGNGVYEGSTKDKDCKSTLRGASYATSVVRVEKDRIVSWDQGFNDKGEQVWGAVKSGYIFEKKQ